MGVLDALRSVPFDDAQPAMVYAGVVLSRGELFGRAREFAQALGARGLADGDRVGLVMVNPAVFLVSLLGVACAGAQAVALPVARLSEGYPGTWSCLGLSWLVHDTRNLAAWPVPPECQVLSVHDVYAPASWPRYELGTITEVDDGRPWLLSMSSGTTGEPKFVVTSQKAFEASLRLGEQFGPGERVMLFLEHTMYWTVATAFRVVRAGGVAVFQSTKVSPRVWLEAMRQAHTHVLVLSADAASKLAHVMLEAPDLGADMHVSRVVVGGGRLSPRARDLFCSRWGAQVVVVYGSTEMGPMAVWRSSDAPADGGSLSPYAGVEAQVVDAQGQPLPTGEVGLLRLRSAAMFSGYLDAHGGMASPTSDWFYPGDRASMGQTGQIDLHGRSDHVLNLGGHKVDPEAIEALIQTHTGVSDVAVTLAAVGAAQVQVLVALLVLRAPAPLQEVKAHALQVLPPAHRPTFWLTVAQLPRNASGKLQRQQLAHMIMVQQGDVDAA